jgi:radical SAM protein with 4Fe4S-binding SPASM domain
MYGEYTCNAPFNNMYVQLTGKVSPCWKSVGFGDTWSKDRSLMDIWKGNEFQKYRDALIQDAFIYRCKECKTDIDNGVYPLAKAYENFPVNHMPSMMEIELSNQCNLECIMCSGFLSSGIRKNRDKLPPLPQIFDDSFNEQMKEFIPHLTELRVNGGEPFAQKILLDLLDVVAEIKPDLKVNIATNGTVYNKRVQSILDKCNISLNVSIDSLIPKRYEEIRINASFNILMKNFEIFNNYHHKNNKLMSVMVNPMNMNWDEMVGYIPWATEKKVNIWYNTILYPHHLTIRNLPAKEIGKIIDYMEKEFDELSGHDPMNNIPTLKNLIDLIKQWYLDALAEIDIPKYDDRGSLLHDKGLQ